MLIVPTDMKCSYHLTVIVSRHRNVTHLTRRMCKSDTVKVGTFVERSGSGVELRTLDYENPGSNPGCGVKTLGKFFHSTLLQFTQLNK